MRQTVSAVIITLNEAERLAHCVGALEFCDEILVVDSGSSDDTPALARSLGARVIEHPWMGFGRQKQFAVEQASCDWVLCIDADEWVSPELAHAIQAVLHNPEASGYRFPRCNRFLGRYLRHGEGYPDLNLRLFDRRQGGWSQDTVHEKVIVQGRVDRLTGDLLHESGETLEYYLRKQNRYTSLQAEAAYRAGKRCFWPSMLLSPLFRFFKFYVLRAGFLDGIPGLIHILIGCHNSFYKYAKLCEQHVHARLTARKNQA